MVRDFISLDRQFCALWPHWMRAQLRVMEAQAYADAKSGGDSQLKYSKSLTWGRVVLNT